jgi:3-phosphoshikimate 1-carboxyvinyltransferase
LGRGGDLGSTRGVVEALGADVRQEGATLRIRGCGLRGLAEPADALDCGNSGTTIRLVCGVLAGQAGRRYVLDGDASLRKRPMRRVTRVLEPFGGRFELPEGDRPPVVVHGQALRGTTVDTELSSAQVKSAAFLAGLLAEGPTEVCERGPSRDHTERMLGHLGVVIERTGTTARLTPPDRLPATEWRLPGDLSSAAFWLAAAAILPGSEFTVEDVGLNPTRAGFLDVLRAMGAGLTCEQTATWGGEPVGRVTVRGGGLHGARIDGQLALRALDELPLVAVLAAVADGETVVADAAELRVKESDRVAAMTEGLRSMGARIESTEDGWVIEGGAPLRGAGVQVFDDHRIAMSLTVAGLVADGDVELDDPAVAAVSYPEFIESLRRRTS